MGITYSYRKEFTNEKKYHVFKVKRGPFIFALLFVILSFLLRLNTSIMLLVLPFLIPVSIGVAILALFVLIYDFKIYYIPIKARYAGKEVIIKGGLTIFAKNTRETWVEI